MRKSRFRLTAAVLMVALLVLVPVAAASTVTVHSTPNGDITATASSGSLTNKDKDDDFDTLTQADRLGLFWSVANNTDADQTIHVTVVLDGPGTTRDTTVVDEDVVVPAHDLTQAFSEVQVKHKDWPAGSYSWSVTGSGSETATATSTFTIDYGNS